MSDSFKKYFNSNKELWNKKTSVHKNSDFYDLEGFKAGKNVLKQIELTELGDVKDKKLLHLQCHFGLDTMSWARMGADVTGVDFSDKAIEVANQIKSDLGINAKFICSNIYDLKKHLDDPFDVVFTSYGVIGWLPDLNKWADVINHFLKPGGTFYMVEFHPMVWMLDDDFEKIKYSYFNEGVIEIDAEGTYADRNADIRHKEYSWNHNLSEVINALLNQGLEIEHMNEFDYSPYDCFPNTVKNEDGNYYIEGFERILPLVYSIKATRGIS
ncbi:MAG: class I SAM-dependent methyltransferase [Cytophagales bacterium]|nr:class I SAM-dependent methyltransferase [Cytophagales bacterium]